MQLIRAENNDEKTASFHYSSFETVKVGMTRKTEELPPLEKLFFFFVFFYSSPFKLQYLHTNSPDSSANISLRELVRRNGKKIKAFIFSLLIILLILTNFSLDNNYINFVEHEN